MREELIKLLDKAYAPYSKFKVAAIIETADGKYIPGVNVENASYGAAICAERNAVTTAVAMGYRKGDFKKIYIMVSGDKLSMPCFICRQALVDYCNLDLEIISYNILGENNKYILNDLTPNSFGEENSK